MTAVRHAELEQHGALTLLIDRLFNTSDVDPVDRGCVRRISANEDVRNSRTVTAFDAEFSQFKKQKTAE